MWNKKKLGELCLIKSGDSNARDADDNGKYALFDRSKKIKKSKRFLFDCEALIIPGEGKEFLPRYYKGKFDLHQRAYAIHQFKPELNIQYLFYHLVYNKNYFSKVAVGATVKSLRQRHFDNLEVYYPSPSEQQRIVAKLDAVFAEIDKALTVAQTSANTAEMLLQNHLSEVFKGGDDWVDKSIDDMTDKTKNVNPNKSPNTQFKYVDVSSVSNKKFVITKTLLLFGKDAPSRAKKNIITNDIIFATVRPTLKRIAIVPKELDSQVASTGYVVLRMNKSNHFKFLFYFLLSNIFMKAMNSLQRGASYPAVTDMEVKLQRLKVPNYQKQIKIAEKLDALMLSVNSFIEIQNKKIEKLILLKQSTLQQALTEN